MSSVFPQITDTSPCIWAPVFLSPILGSPERLVVAVAVASAGDFHIEPANNLKRLECLYGRNAETALFAVEVALSELEGALADQGQDAIRAGRFVFSGVEIGPVSAGEAGSLQELAATWMGALSSLYKYEPPNRGGIRVSDSDGAASSDRLPILVLEQVAAHAPSLMDNFSEEIRLRRQRRSRTGIAGISIDYSGSRYVANFATLNLGAAASSVDRIKRKMFDLAVRRDGEAGLFAPRAHEMIIFAPSRDSPLVNDKQIERLDEALRDLTEQSKKEGFDLIAHSAVDAIGKRVVTAESAVSGTA